MTAKKNSSPKSDKLQVKNDLDKLADEVLPEAEPYEFWFKGKQFITQNPYELDLGAALNMDDNDVSDQLKQFLGDEGYEEFMALKPKMKHANALVVNAEKYYQQFYGNPGESEGSQTS